MRYLAIAAAATFLLLPLSAPANACGAANTAAMAPAAMAQASTTDYSAAKKKPARKPKVKVEYMRAAPMK